MRLSRSLFAASLLAVVRASNVLELVPDNWDSIIGVGKPGLVEFFAPWCGHCKNLAPVYEQVADAFAHAKDKVIVAKVDADGEGRPLGSKYDVTGFPTLKWFNADGTHEAYEGGRDLDALVSFISTKSGVKSSIKPPPPPDTLILDYSTFDEVVLNEDNDALVAFTAPWCGHCKSMKPAYEKVAGAFKSENNCIVANVDADDKKNKDLAARYDVKSYPTIKFFPKGSSEPISFEGQRSELGFLNFLNEKCGTFRTIGGGLSEQAGRVPELDVLAGKFGAAAADVRATLYDDATALAAAVGAGAKQYLRVMEKLANGTEGYLEKESKRLQSILAKRSLSPSKLDEITVKSNILRAFTEAPKEEEVEEKTEEETKRDTAEL